MENSYFILSKQDISEIVIERFHMCLWEFNNTDALAEFGCELQADCIQGKSNLSFELYLPWINTKSSPVDFYSKLKDTDNSRFIFNDSITNTINTDGGKNTRGVIHEFLSRSALFIVPVELEVSPESHTLMINIDLGVYIQLGRTTNIYFRFSLNPDTSSISTRKNGLGKSTIIYDIKINERRNLPDNLIPEANKKNICKINNCFYFNIVPNSYNLAFFDSTSLKNIRTLEYDSFKKYLGNRKIKKDELVVVFNKKSDSASYSFYSTYLKERIGVGQFALAVLINLLCGILLFIPSYRKSFQPELPLSQLHKNIPIELCIAIALGLGTLFYFMRLSFASRVNKFIRRLIFISKAKNQ